MSDNVIKSTDVDPKPAKKAAAKKTAKPKVAAPAKDGSRVIVFESGASYNSHGRRFTQDNRIQEVTEAEAELFLALDNFRLATQEEVDNFNKTQEG